MRYFLLFLITVGIFLSGCGNKSANKSQEAVDYNKKFMDRQWELVKSNDTLLQQLEGTDDETTEKHRLHCITLCDSAEEAIKKIGPFYRDESYQLAVLKYFGAMKKLYATEWHEMMQLRNTILNSEDYVEPNDLRYKRLEKIGVQIDSKFNKYLTDLGTAQQAFAKKYKFLLDVNPNTNPTAPTDATDEPMKEEIGE